jgi:hypothetical protein
MKPIHAYPLDMDRSIYRELPSPHHEEIIVNGEDVAMMLTCLCEHVGKDSLSRRPPLECNTLGTVPFSPRLLHLRCTLQQKTWIPACAGMTEGRS